MNWQQFKVIAGSISKMVWTGKWTLITNSSGSLRITFHNVIKYGNKLFIPHCIYFFHSKYTIHFEIATVFTEM